MPFLVITTYFPSKFMMKNGRLKDRNVAIKNLPFKKFKLLRIHWINYKLFYQVIIKSLLAKAGGKDSFEGYFFNLYLKK